MIDFDGISYWAMFYVGIDLSRLLLLLASSLSKGLYTVHFLTIKTGI